MFGLAAIGHVPLWLIDEAKICAEVRDYIAHQWRERTGQIPEGSPMSSSWSGDTRPRSLLRHFAEDSKRLTYLKVLVFLEDR